MLGGQNKQEKEETNASRQNILNFAFALFLLGCATTKADWEKANRINTLVAYAVFAHRFSD